VSVAAGCATGLARRVGGGAHDRRAVRGGEVGDRSVPRSRQHRLGGWGGGAHTAVLFGVGKSVIGVYLGHASIGSSYGAAGSLVVFLVWIYYSSLIMFLGAEITFVYAQHRRRRVRPTELAVPADRGA